MTFRRQSIDPHLDLVDMGDGGDLKQALEVARLRDTRGATEALLKSRGLMLEVGD